MSVADVIRIPQTDAVFQKSFSIDSRILESVFDIGCPEIHRIILITVEIEITALGRVSTVGAIGMRGIGKPALNLNEFIFRQIAQMCCAHKLLAGNAHHFAAGRF